MKNKFEASRVIFEFFWMVYFPYCRDSIILSAFDIFQLGSNPLLLKITTKLLNIAVKFFYLHNSQNFVLKFLSLNKKFLFSLIKNSKIYI